MITLEQHLTAHQWLGLDAEYRARCGCGAKFDLPEQHRAHIAETWREARTVRTADELDALPFLTAIRECADTDRSETGADGNRVYEKWLGGGWVCIGDYTEGIVTTQLPSLVLWHPEDELSVARHCQETR